MNLQLLLFLLMSIFSIFLLSLEVDGGRFLLQKDSMPMEQSSDSKAKFHGEMRTDQKKKPTDLEHPSYESSEGGEGESGEGVPCGDDDKGESGESNGDYCFEGKCGDKDGESEEEDGGYYEGSDAEDNQGDDSKGGDNDDNENSSDGKEHGDDQDPERYGVNMKKFGT